jgi:hypothetical protein
LRLENVPVPSAEGLLSNRKNIHRKYFYPQKFSALRYLSDNEIVSGALKLDIDDIANFCDSNEKFNNAVCDNNWFWKEKFLLDFGEPEYTHVNDWKSLYKNYGSFYFFGENDGYFGLTDSVNRLAPTKIHSLRVKYFLGPRNSLTFVDLNNIIWQSPGGYLETPAFEVFNPSKIPNLRVKYYVMSWSSSCWFAVDLNNDVWSFGESRSGSLGLDATIKTEIPIKIPQFKAKHIVSYYHTVVIDLNADVWVNLKTLSYSFGYLAKMNLDN